MIKNRWHNHIILNDNNFSIIDLNLKERITILSGDSASGKTYIFNSIKRYVRQNNTNNILCINLDTINYADAIIEKIKSIKNGLIIVDEANKVLKNKELTEFIRGDFESKNNYIIIGRSLSLNTKYTELAEPDISEDKISIKYLVG